MTVTKQVDTPTKSRVIAVCEWNNAHGKPLFNSDIFRDAGVSGSTGWRILRHKDRPRTFHNCPDLEETRGRNRKLTDEDVDRLEKFLVDGGLDARLLDFKQLVDAAGLDVDISERTVQRRLAERGFKRYPAAQSKSHSLCPKHKTQKNRVQKQKQNKKKEAPYLCPKHRAQRAQKK